MIKCLRFAYNSIFTDKLTANICYLLDRTDTVWPKPVLKRILMYAGKNKTVHIYTIRLYLILYFF